MMGSDATRNETKSTMTLENENRSSVTLELFLAIEQYAPSGNSLFDDKLT